MKSIKITAGVVLLLLTLGLSEAYAQWGLGVSYERRNDTPENGFGIQLEKDFLQRLPIVFVRSRLHFSYFSEDASYDIGAGSITTGSVEAYDFGGAVMGGAGLGLFAPYIGLGIGADNWEYSTSTTGGSRSNNTHYYYGIAGVSITPVPFIKPYLEYRLTSYDSVSDARKEIGEGKGRFHIGVTIRF